MRNALLLAASLLVALGLGEGAARLLGLGPARETPDVVLRLPLQHGYLDHRVGRAEIAPADPEVRFRTDARGYIEPARPHAAPDATVAFLGGSTTECRAVREELRFPALTAALLGERGLRVNALNAGRSAGTVHDALHVLLDRVAEDAADLALLMEAVNDAGVLARDGSYAGRSGAAVAGRDLAKWSLQLAARRLALAELLRARLLPAARMRAERAWDASKARRPAPRAPYRARVLGLRRALPRPRYRAGARDPAARLRRRHDAALGRRRGPGRLQRRAARRRGASGSAPRRPRGPRGRAPGPRAARRALLRRPPRDRRGLAPLRRDPGGRPRAPPRGAYRRARAPRGAASVDDRRPHLDAGAAPPQ